MLSELLLEQVQLYVYERIQKFSLMEVGFIPWMFRGPIEAMDLHLVFYKLKCIHMVYYQFHYFFSIVYYQFHVDVVVETIGKYSDHNLTHLLIVYW